MLIFELLLCVNKCGYRKAPARSRILYSFKFSRVANKEKGEEEKGTHQKQQQQQNVRKENRMNKKKTPLARTNYLTPLYSSNYDIPIGGMT